MSAVGASAAATGGDAEPAAQGPHGPQASGALEGGPTPGAASGGSEIPRHPHRGPCQQSTEGTTGAGAAGAGQLLSVSEATAKMTPDLSYLLDDKEVPPAVRPLLVQLSATSVARLHLLAETRTELRTLICDEWGFVGIEARMLGVTLGDAWETARTRVEKERSAAAEQRASGASPTLPRSAHLALRISVEQTYEPLTDRLAPSSALVDKVLAQVEDSYLTAIPLTEVTSRADPEGGQHSLSFDSTGAVHVKKRRTDKQPPDSPESLRTRLRIWGAAFLFAKAKHPSRDGLQDVSPYEVNKYIDHLLSDEVAEFAVPAAGLSRAPLSVVLSYDLAIRTDQAKRMNEGASFSSALRAAARCPELRERHFVTPLLLQVASSNRGSGGGGSAATASGAGGGTGGGADKGRGKKRKAGAGGGGSKGAEKGGGSGSGGKGKSGGKGGGKAKPKAGGPGPLRVDNSGNEICFKFNSPAGCPGCDRVHCCRRCLGKHSGLSCPQTPSR